jgi:hypothetical protein
MVFCPKCVQHFRHFDPKSKEGRKKEPLGSFQVVLFFLKGNEEVAEWSPLGEPTFLFGGGKQESRPFGRLSSGIQE